MGRSLNRDTEATVSTPERRSLRHSKPPEGEVKTNVVVKGKRSIGKKKDEKSENKTEEDSPSNLEDSSDKNNKSTSEAEGETSNSKSGVSEISNVKPTSSSSRSSRSSRKRQLSETADTEESDDKSDEKNDDTIDDQLDDKSNDKADKTEDQEEEKGDLDSSELKNGKEEPKVKSKKKRKPPTKKKKEVPDESELWTPLEPLDGDERRDPQKKIQSKSDRRKQALVERQAPAEPMLQKQLPRQRRNSDASECEVLVSVPRHHRRSKTIVTVDIDDEASETGSIQIVAEPDVDSVFDFKRLLIQYRNVNLPSSLWGVHKDPRNLFVSFTRFNPDYPDTNGLIIDRAVVFQGSLDPEAFVNGEKIELPEMFNIVETIFDAAQVIQFINNTVVPVSHPPSEPSDVTC